MKNKKDREGSGKGPKTPSLLHLLTVKKICSLSALSIITYLLLYPNPLALPGVILGALLALFYPYIDVHRRTQTVEMGFHRRVVVGFILAISVLLILILVRKLSVEASDGRMLAVVLAGIIGAIGLVILVDLFITYRDSGAGWLLRFIPGVIYVMTASLLIGFRIHGTGATTTAEYSICVVLGLTGVLLAIYSWKARNRKVMGWFYLYASFLSIVVLPIAFLIASSLLSQPRIILFSCHAGSSAEVRRKGIVGRWFHRRRRTRQLEELRDEEGISVDFYSRMKELVE